MGSYINSLFELPVGGEEKSIIKMTQTAISNLTSLQDTNDNGLKDFEQFLNYVYYGTGQFQTKSSANQVNEFSQGVEKKLEEISYDFIGAMSNTGQINIAGKGIRAGAVETLSLGEIDKRIEVVSNFIAKSNTISQYQTTLNKLKDLRNYLIEAKRLLVSRWGTNLSNNKKLTSKTAMSQGVNLLEEINDIWKQVTFLGKLPSNTDIGEVLEKSLPVAKEVLDGQINGTVGQMLNNAFSGKSLGQNRVSTDRVATEIAGVSIEGYEGDRRVPYGSSYSYIFGDNSDSTFSLSINALEHIQQKMDVQMEITLPEGEKKEMRISAKSWNKMAGKNLGETTLLNALLRTTNLDATLAWGLQENYSPYASQKYNNANEWANNLVEQAKYICALDIIAGIGQNGGYADTLVVQDRGQKEFHVYSMKNILQKIQEKSKDSSFAVKGINEDALTSEVLNYSQHLTTQSWVNALLTLLAGQKVSISYKKT